MPFPALLIPLLLWSALAALSSWAVSRAIPLTTSQSVKINAPLDSVWETISDLERYPEWNDHVVETHAPAQLIEGEKFMVKVRHPDSPRLKVTLNPHIASLISEQELTWTTKFWAQWLLTVTQTIRLTAVDDQCTEVTREMRFTGALSPGVPFMISMEKLHKASNQKLKELLEGSTEN